MTDDRDGLRILHVLDHSVPLQSGYSFRTLAILREQRARGWRTFQLTTPKQGSGRVSVEAVEGFDFYRTPFAGGTRAGRPTEALAQMMATARRLSDVVRRVRPHVLHAHSPVLTALPALWIGRRFGVPVVYEVRALWEDGAVDQGVTHVGSARYRLSRAVETYALRHVDHVTTICAGLRQEIATRGIPEERITVIPNAVDTGAFAFDAVPDASLRTELGLVGATVLGFAGSFYGYEGLDVLLEALARLSSLRNDIHVLLLGGGPREQALKELAARLGVADRVVFVGRVPQREVSRYYGLIDVLVYPRHRVRVTELVTPLKPLEAMAQGRIVIASNVGGHRELIRDGETGFLFEAGDPDALASAITSVLKRRDNWQRVRVCARRFVERERTWSNSVGRYAAVYRHIAAAHTPLVRPSAGNA